METVRFLIKLAESVCVVVLLGHVVARAKFFHPFLFGERPRVRDLLLISAIFGLFSIYGTLDGAKIGNAVLNVRDAGPMIAIQNAEQVMERERRLRAQIEQLRIEIDQVKRRRQVAEITDTEYFQELQKKSRQMRAAATDIDLE